MLKYYNNQYLFSEIYLNEITNLEEDRSLISTLETITETSLYADRTNLSKWNESFVHELLRTLKFKVDPIDENVALLKQYGEDDKPLTICYSLLPDKNLDNSLMGSNYAYEIITAVRKYDLKWGILTNGNQWRIYHTNEPTPYENYLEIDLEAILREQDKSAFQLIFFFLKSENFIVDREGNSKFDLFKKESQDKIAYIEDELKNALKQKEEGGQDILSNICFGYVQYLRNEGTNDFSKEDLRDEIYGGSLLYMFRLLFLLYARARDLMSEKDSDSFDNLINKAKEYHIRGNADSFSKELWVQLRAIFGEIDRVYNGGLFNRDENKYTRFIENAIISDTLLSGVIYNMSHYEEKNGAVKLISYRDMNVRHLGTLYEGLLEHKLFIAEEDIEVKVAKKEIQFVPESQGGIIKEGQYIPKGKVYFGNDKGLRKATGSYYTPEYIVEYIVTNTVDEKLNELQTKFDRQLEPLAQDLEVAISDKEKHQLRLLIKNQIVDFVENEILILSVLDPAMGSGHFLVNATSHIANFITKFLNCYRVESELETNTKYWSRKVVENCIYGIDLNILAAELAKLSLWILTMAKDKPLSFLNHHLKVGNSLIGAKLSELGKYPFSKKEQVQKDLFTQDPDFKSIVQQIIDDYSQIRKENSDSKKNIETKKEHLDEIDRLIKPYKEMCDLHTSIYFGNDIKEDDYDNIITNKLHPKNNYNEKYFHWELEFPEVLLKKNGFDSIIGNPPYIGFRESRKGDSEYLSMVYSKIHLSKGDIYYYFIYKSLINLYPTGYFGFITTRYWMESESGGLLRNFIEKNEFKYKIIDFETYQVFDKVGTATSITILSKNIRLANLYYCYKNGENAQISHQFLKNKIDDNFSKKELRNTVNSKWQFLSQIEFNLFRKIESECITFSDIGDVKQGIVSGCDAAFIYTNEEIQTHNIEKTNLVKYLKIGDLLPFYHDKTRTFYLNYLNHLSSIQEFPNTISFLGQFLDKLIKRRECESGKIKYFHLQWGRSKELFDGPKLITRKISPINCFILDLDFYYSGADTTILVPHNRTNLFNQFFLLGFLNSDLSTFLYQLSAKKMDYRYEYNPGSVMDILVPEKLRDQQFVDSQDVLFRNNHKSDDEYLNIANYAKSLSASEYNSLEYNTLIKNLNLEVCKLFNIEYSLINEFVENKNYRWI